jgi:hypothetical protein
MNASARLALAALAAILTFAVATTETSAHERRQVGGYVVVVGFKNEPAFIEEMNGASITIFTADGRPVENAQRTLQVEVSAAGAPPRAFELAPERGRPGGYVAEFIPTKTGAYSFRFFGTIDGQPVDEKFESGPNRFDEVKMRAELEYPTKVPTNGELAAQIQQLQTRGPQTPGDAGGAPPAAGTSDTAGLATLAPVGLSLLALALAVVALMRGRRPAATAAATSRTPSGRSEPV